MSKEGLPFATLMIVVMGVLVVSMFYFNARPSAPLPSIGQSTSTTAIANSVSAVEGMVANIKASNPMSWWGDVLGYATNTQSLFIVHQGSECCGGDIDIYALSSPTSTQPISHYATIAYVYQAFAVANNYVFIATRPDGPAPAPTLQVVDVSDPLKPELAASPTFPNEIVQHIQFDGKNIVLTGKMAFNIKPMGVLPLGFSQILDFSNINDIKALNPMPPVEIFYNPAENYFDPQNSLLEWQDGGLDYAILAIIKNYSSDSNGDVELDLTFSLLITNNTTSTKTAKTDIQEIMGSSTLASSMGSQTITLGPGEQARDQRVAFINPGKDFTTGGNSNIHFSVDLSSTSSLTVVPASPNFPATSSEPLISPSRI